MPVMDLSSTVTAFFSHTLSVTRAGAAGTYVEGEFVPPSTSVVSVAAMIAPLTGRELQRFAEGRKTGERKQVFTVDELLVGEPSALKADLVTFDGATWEVEHVDRYKELGNFYRSIVRKETP